MNLYRNILKKSIIITWKHKFLWFFGFFATFLGGFGAYEILINRSDAYYAQNVFNSFQRLQEMNILSTEFFSNLSRVFHLSPVSMIIVFAVILVLLALFVFLIWLAVVSQVALVSSSAHLIKSDKHSSKLNIQRGVSEGIGRFWPVLGLNFFSRVLIYMSFFLLSIAFVLMVQGSQQWIADLLYVILFVIFIPIALIISFIFNYAICYVVIDKKSFVRAVEDGWRLFLKNWLVTLEMGLILFLVTFGFTLAIIMAAVVVAIPIYLLVNLLFIWGAGTLSFWLIIITIVFLTLFVAVMGALVTTFRISSWTTLFVRLNSEEKSPSKIVRLADKIRY